MNLICSICQDLLEQSNDIFITPCGHVFHFPCLMQWLEKSMTCPQCRQKMRRDGITKVYFNFANSEAIKDDEVTLQQKLDSVTFQLTLSKNNHKNCEKENVTLKKQNVGLREEVKKVENELNRKNAAIYGFKQQAEHLKDKLHDYEEIKREKKVLENKLQTYDNVKVLLCSSAEEVDRLVQRTPDINSLMTYVSIMKRELSVSVERRKELRETIKRLQHDLQTLKMDRNSIVDDYTKKVEMLEEAIAISKSEKDELQKRLNELESGKKSCDKFTEETPKTTTDKELSRKRETETDFDINTVLPKKMKTVSEKIDLSSSLTKKNDSDIILVSPTVKKTKENEENSPYLPTKSKSILAIKQRSQSGFSLGANKRIISSKMSISSLKSSSRGDTSIAFDGFGGHSKIETFPLPKSSPNKLKRPASDSSKSKKVKRDLSNNKLDDYIINLT